MLTSRHRRRVGGLLWGFWCLQCVLTSPVAAAPWLVINEIHYHPPGGDDEEFIEILSREPPRVDLTEWTIEGEVDFRFPPGTVLQSGEFLVVAKNPEVCLERHRGRGRILGPYAGRLDNKSGEIILRNAARAIHCQVRYGSRGRWPVTPDGTGHTLSLLDPLLDPSDPLNWAASGKVGGTPGGPNFPREAPRVLPLVKVWAPWKYWRGKKAPPAGWQEAAFDDSTWESGPSGLGFGDDDDATIIDDMRGNYLSLFARHAFEAPAGALSQRLIFRVDWDDGFVAYLNGKEIARENLGEPGSDHPFDQPATGLREAGVSVQYDLGLASGKLAAGRNVLAVAVFNEAAKSSDLSIIPSLELRDDAAALARPARPVLNELRSGPDAAQNFVEVYNAGGSPVSLAGWFLSDDPKKLEKWRISSPEPLPAGGFVALTAKDVGGELSLPADGLLALTEPGGRRVADALPLEGGGKKGEKGGAAGKADARPAAEVLRGRYPDGSRDLLPLESATPGQANAAPRTVPVVINELLYHPITGKVEDEFVELYNRGSEPVSLAGFRLTGGASFEFPAVAAAPGAPGAEGTVIPAGGYLVIAKDPAGLARKYGLAKQKVVGPFEGQLSDGGEALTLRDARGHLVNRVEYGDRSPWPATADGLGASLELIDPALDNSLAGSWAASNENSKGKWETFTYEKEHLLFENRNLPEFQFLLLNQGECLIDDVRVLGVFEENFERGAGSWKAMGTHERSGIVTEGPAGRNHAFHVVSDGRGNARNNYVSRDLLDGLSPGKRYKVAFRARWQQGSPLLLSRTPGQGVARVHRLAIPERLGTPGAENSARRKDPPPVVGTPSQSPVTPTTGQPVEITAPISSVGPLRGALLHYRAAGAAGFTEVPLAELAGASAAGEARRFGGTIPALPAGKVEFYLTATDERGASGSFPAGAPERVALYGVGLAPSPKFPTYTVLISDAEWARFQKRPRMSNRLIDATLVYGDSRILYNVGLRRRGSPFTRSTRNWRVVFGAERLDGRGTLTLDGQQADGTKLNERLTYWLVDQLRAPNARQQYVYLRIPGVEEGIYEDVEKIDRNYLARWLDTPPPPEIVIPVKTAPGQRRAPSRQKAALDRAEGNLHKVDDWWELLSNQERFYREANFLFKGTDPEAYRWNFPPRSNALDEDFTPLLQLVQLFDQRSSPDKAFDERLESMVDVDEWLRVLAARTLVDDWDTIGRRRGKNAFIYRSPVDGRWRLLPWDCDLSWQDPRSAIFSEQFEGIRRILKRPQYRRRFLGYLGYLADRKFDPEHLGAILGDLQKRTGAFTKPYADFAAARREMILHEVPRAGGGMRVAGSRRVAGQGGKPDVVRASGIAASPRVSRLRLGGREGRVRWMGDGGFEAEFLMGPEGGDLTLEGLEVGGEVVAQAKVAVRERKGALELTPPDGGLERPRELVWPDLPEEPAPEVVAGAQAPGPALPAPAAAPASPEEPKPAASAPGTAAPAAAISGQPAAVSSEGAGASSLPDSAATAAPAADSIPAPFVAPAPPPRGRTPRADEETEESAELVAPTEPPAAAAPEGKGGIPRWQLATAGAAIVSILVGVAMLYLRRRGGSASPAVVEESFEALRSSGFSEAAQALKRLCRDGRESVPWLLQALEDRSPTPFHRLKRGPEGLTATPAPPGSPGAIQVRHVAVLLLEHLIGKPPVEKATRMHWHAHWEAVKLGAADRPAVSGKSGRTGAGPAANDRPLRPG